MKINTRKKKVSPNFSLNIPYQYGFSTIIEKEAFPSGINQSIIDLISIKKNEFNWIKKFRTEAYKNWLQFEFPIWSHLKIKPIFFNKLKYYSENKRKDSLNKNKKAILKTFDKLNVSLNETKKGVVALDVIFDSISVLTTFKKKLGKEGVIFCALSEGLQYFPELINKYLGKVVSSTDNFFSALNAAVFSDGSFCYVPQNTTCPLELSTYFRMNDIDAGQFERTLIVVEKNSSLNYFEGCTAPKYNKNQLHAAVVELIAFDNPQIKYSTMQNWYSGTKEGFGGIYNFVTKRGLCLGKRANISWTQVELGSSITWKYPSCILIGENSMGKFYSVALTNDCQQADTGTKMIHLGKYTASEIISKGISCKNSKNIYRGLVKISANASLSKNLSKCDSFLVGSCSVASTLPYLQVSNSNSFIEHEAQISKVNEEKLFYLMQRGLNAEQAISLLIGGFCKEVLTRLPMEFAAETLNLLFLKFEKTKNVKSKIL